MGDDVSDEVLETLLENGAKLNDSYDITGYLNNLNQIKIFVEHGFDPCCQMSDYVIGPIALSVMFLLIDMEIRDIEIFRYFVEKGIDLTLQDRNGKTVLDIIQNNRYYTEGYPEIVQLLEEELEASEMYKHP